jgi:hypothetical protein
MCFDAGARAAIAVPFAAGVSVTLEAYRPNGQKVRR